MLPTDELTEAQSAQIWHGLGVSEDTLQQRGDFEPDVEKVKRAEENADAMDQQVQQAQAIQDVTAPGQSTGQGVGAPLPSQQAGQAPQQPPTKAKTAPKRAAKATATRKRGGR